MKIFTKNIDRCNDCPNIGYIHYDGEGESCPYEYFDAVCSKTKQALPNTLIDKNAEYLEYTNYGRRGNKPFVPDRCIPTWCPLRDVDTNGHAGLDINKPCSRCGGKGCRECRGTGFCAAGDV